MDGVLYEVIEYLLDLDLVRLDEWKVILQIGLFGDLVFEIRIDIVVLEFLLDELVDVDLFFSAEVFILRVQ